MSSEEKIKPWLKEIAEIISNARNQRELELLLEGLLTPSELEVLHLRWHLLRLLQQGLTQREISKQLKISLGKIARGSRLLKYGSEDVTELVTRIRHEQTKNEE